MTTISVNVSAPQLLAFAASLFVLFLAGKKLQAGRAALGNSEPEHLARMDQGRELLLCLGVAPLVAAYVAGKFLFNNSVSVTLGGAAASCIIFAIILLRASGVTPNTESQRTFQTAHIYSGRLFLLAAALFAGAAISSAKPLVIEVATHGG